MTAMLTFYPGRALLEATAAGHSFLVPLHQDPARVAAWAKMQELRTGKVTLWDHAFELPGGQLGGDANLICRVALAPRAMAVHDSPGAYAQLFEGVDTARGDAFHSHALNALYVGTQKSGIHIHGLPLCNRRSCIIVLQRWDDLRRAIAGEKRLSFSIFA